MGFVFEMLDVACLYNYDTGRQTCSPCHPQLVFWVKIRQIRVGWLWATLEWHGKKGFVFVEETIFHVKILCERGDTTGDSCAYPKSQMQISNSFQKLIINVHIKDVFSEKKKDPSVGDFMIFSVFVSLNVSLSLVHTFDINAVCCTHVR